ncbi:1642_t:CDS:2 [Ambispora leptoticha]|uniref:1642_t:CDS:1 n=1 Tax=Ambispora leptoticha TaxID=144679 RepID=A0A9N9EBN7_9GLOM|nr:1642_t:CDS:2 [Ambispora leptoticha]
MQAPRAIRDFPHSPPSPSNSKRRQTMFNETQPPNKRQRPGVATNLLYKLTELAAYTSAVATETYQTFIGVVGTDGLPPASQQQFNQRKISNAATFNNRYSMALDGYGEDIMQIKADDDDCEMGDEEFVETTEVKSIKKNECDWSNVNADEEEPPPPYDSSWSMVNILFNTLSMITFIKID